MTKNNLDISTISSEKLFFGIGQSVQEYINCYLHWSNEQLEEGIIELKEKLMEKYKQITTLNAVGDMKNACDQLGIDYVGKNKAMIKEILIDEVVSILAEIANL
jgi:hypothetical protein